MSRRKLERFILFNICINNQQVGVKSMLMKFADDKLEGKVNTKKVKDWYKWDPVKWEY